MNISEQIATHFRQLYFGGNWTSVSMKEVLSDIDWVEATTTLNACNTIATLVFHTNYYVDALIKVLRGDNLNAKDIYSFQTPAITAASDWNDLRQKSWKDAEDFANLIEKLPEAKLNETFTDVKYGNYYRNLHGIIEHTHYHLGQIVLLKKLLKADVVQKPMTS